MQKQFEPASGTRDFLAAEFEEREEAFGIIRSVFVRYGFEPLQTPAFERLDVLMGKYGDEGEKLVFKILRRGEHEASGEADLALRYDLTVPLARVAAAYQGRLPMPYKRYAMSPVWRADRPGRGRFREFVQCDLDILGSASLLADAEALSAQHDVLAELGIPDFTINLNSRHVLAGLLEAFKIPAELGTGVLTSLDKLDKLPPAEVIAELIGRGLPEADAAELVGTLAAPDAIDRVRTALKPSDEGVFGLDEVDGILALVGSQVPEGRVVFAPQMVRGLSYYTGPVWETTAKGSPGSLGGGGRYDHLIEALGGPDLPATGASFGVERLLEMRQGGSATARSRLDVAVTIVSEELTSEAFGLAAVARSTGLRASIYLGASGKLGKQLRWASDQGARWCLIYGNREKDAGIVKVRDMLSRDEADVPVADLASHLADAAAH